MFQPRPRPQRQFDPTKIPGFGPLPSSKPPKLPKLKGQEKRAMDFIKNPWSFKPTGLKNDNLLSHPSPRRQAHLDWHPGLRQNHQLVLHQLNNPNDPINKGLVANWNHPQGMTPSQRIDFHEQMKRSDQQANLAGFSPPVAAGLGWLQRLGTGTAHATEEFGPGVLDIGKHLGMESAHLGGQVQKAMGLRESSYAKRTPSQGQYFKQLGEAQLKSFKDSLTTGQIWTDPFQFASNALILGSAGAGLAGRAGAISDLATAARAGDITSAEAMSRIPGVLKRPPTKFRRIQTSPDVGPRMTLYHGGPADLEGNGLKVIPKSGPEVHGGKGLFATSHPDVAKVYADAHPGEGAVHEITVPRKSIAHVKQKLTKDMRRALRPVFGDLPKETTVGDLFAKVSNAPSEGLHDLIKPVGAKHAVPIDELHDALSRAGIHGIEYPHITDAEDLATWHDVLGRDVSGPEAERSYEGLKNSNEYKMWNPELLQKLGQEPQFIEPPVFRSQLGSMLQRRVLDPVTEKSLQHRLYGMRPVIRALGREFKVPNHMLGLLPEGKVGKLIRRDWEQQQMMARGVHEVKVAREYGVHGPYGMEPKDVGGPTASLLRGMEDMSLYDPRTRQSVIQALKETAAKHTDTLHPETQRWIDQVVEDLSKQPEWQLHFEHDIPASSTDPAADFPILQSLSDELENIVGRPADDAGTGFGLGEHNWWFDNKAEAEAAQNRLNAHAARMGFTADGEATQADLIPMQHEDLAELHREARERGSNWAPRERGPRMTEEGHRIADKVDAEFAASKPFFTDLEKRLEGIGRNARLPEAAPRPRAGLIARTKKKVGLGPKTQVVGGDLTRGGTKLGVINPRTGEGFWGADSIDGHHQLWQEVQAKYPNPKDQDMFVQVRAHHDPKTDQYTVSPTEGGPDARVNKIGKASLERAFAEGRPPGIHPDKYLSEPERDQVAEILEKHRHLDKNDMADEHLAHVSDLDSEHMVQLFSNEDPLMHGADSVENIPEIKDLIEKHGGEGTHYTWEDPSGTIQAASGLPDELNPTVAHRTGNVHFKNGEDARRFEKEFQDKISSEMDIHPHYHHINPDTEGDIPDDLQTWKDIFSPGASGHRNNEAYARAVLKDLEGLTKEMHPGELQKIAYARGGAEALADKWHTIFNGFPGASETVLRGNPEDYVAVRRPPSRESIEKESKGFSSEASVAARQKEMIVENPKVFMKDPHNYSYIPKGAWQRMKFGQRDMGGAGTVINGIDTLTQMIRAGRFLHPGYLAWAVQNGILHLSQAGMYAIRNAMQHKTELAKMDHEHLAAWDNSVGAGHFGGGISRATAGSESSKFSGLTKALASKWHEVDDKYWRRLSLIHELNREGYHNAESWMKLMDENPQRFRNIARKAQQHAIDYSEMGPGERATLQKLFTAWGWTRGASTYTMRFPFEHPIQFGGATVAARQGQKKLDEYYAGHNGMVPDWLRGDLPIGKGNSPLLAETGIFNPAETLGQLMGALPGLVHGQTENLQSMEAPAPNFLEELMAGQTRYGQQLRGSQRVSTPLWDLIRRFEPAAALSSALESKKGGGTFKQGPLAAASMFGGIPLTQLRSADETAALGMKDYEQSLSRPDEIKFRYNYSLNQFPRELKLYNHKNGSPLDRQSIAAIKGDMEAVEQRDLWQYKYAQAHGANSIRSLPAINRAQAGIAFMTQHKYFTPEVAREAQQAINQAKTESDMDTVATQIWAYHRIGNIVNQWKAAIKKMQPQPLQASR